MEYCQCISFQVARKENIHPQFLKNRGEIRILHLSTAKSWRGGEQQIAYLVSELQDMDVLQWVFCVNGSKMQERCVQEGWLHFTFQRGFSFDPIAARDIAGLCRSLSVNIMHAHDAKAHSLAVLSAVLFQNKTPLVVHRRVDFPIGRTAWSRWKYNHSVVQKIICVSGFIRDLISPNILQKDKLELVYSGIETQRFKGLRSLSKLRSEFSIPEGIPIIANIAALAPHKDYFTFIKAAELILKERQCRFLLIGADGGEESAIRKLISEKQLEKELIITGYRNDIPELLSEIDLLLFTSKTEGLGTTILDAFSAGVPVVASSAGGIPELVEHEVTGLLAPVGDPSGLAEMVRKMLSHGELRNKLVQNAKAKVDSFSKKKMAESVLRVYRGII